MSDSSTPLALGLAGVASVLILSGIQKKTIGEILRGDFTDEGEKGGSAVGVTTESVSGQNIPGLTDNLGNMGPLGEPLFPSHPTAPSPNKGNEISSRRKALEKYLKRKLTAQENANLIAISP